MMGSLRTPVRESAGSAVKAWPAREPLRGVALAGLLLTVSLLPLATDRMPVGAQTPDDPIDGRLLGSAAERRGQLTELAEAWWSEMRAAPDSLATQARLLLWDSVFAHLPEPPPATAWQGLAQAPGVNGWSARIAQWRQFQRLRSAGDFTAADALDVEAGSLRRWLGIGPFGEHAETALHRHYAPVVNFDPDAPVPDRGHLRNWRSLTPPRGETRMAVADEWGQHGGIFYLRAVFSVAQDSPALIQVTAGSFRLWLDGQELGAIDRSEGPRPRSQRYGVQIASGTHVLLLACDGAATSVLLRDADGHALPFEELEPRSRPRTAGFALDPALTARGEVIEEWNRAWQAGTLAREWWLPLALLRLFDGDGPGCRAVLMRCAETPDFDPAALALVATRAEPELGYLPAKWREHWLDGLWEHGLEHDPGAIELRLARARRAYAEDRTETATELLDAILAERPDFLAGWLLLEELCRAREWHSERHVALARLRALAPEHPQVVWRWLRRWEDDDRPDLARAEQATLARVQPTLSHLRALAQATRLAGDLVGAARLLDQLTVLGGDSLQAHSARVHLLHEWGEHALAGAAARELAARRPDDARILNLAAGAAWRTGALDQAVALYRRALGLEPGQIAVARALEELAARQPGAPDAPAPFWKPYAMDVDQALAEAPALDAYPQASAVFLIDQMVTWLRPDGGLEEYYHQLIRLGSVQAVEQFSEFSVQGEPLRLRVLTPEGEELHPTSGNTRSGRFTLPGLVPGAFIEVQSVSRRNVPRLDQLELGPFYFQDPDLETAFHHSAWTVLLPADAPLSLEERHLPFSRTERVLPDGTRELSWLAHAMPRPHPEDFMPPVGEVIPHALLRGAPGRGTLDWSEALASLRPRFAGRDFPTPELRAACNEILGDAPRDRRARVELLRRAVCERIPEDHGGDNATAVWLERAGDRDLCLAGLLRCADIPYREVRVAQRAEFEPFRDWSLPDPGAFQLALLEIPLEDGMLLPITAAYRFAESDRFPQRYSGGRAVVLTSAGAEWTVLPALSLPPCSIRLATTLEFDDPQRVRIAGRLAQFPVEATSYKDQLKDLPASQHRIAIEGFVQRLLPGARLEQGSFPGLTEPRGPFAVEFRAQTSRLIQREGDTYQLRPTLMPAQLRAGFVRGGTRVHPFVNPIEIRTEETTTIRLGDLALARLPEDLVLAGPWGCYTFTTTLDDGLLTLTRTLDLVPFVLPATRVGEFYEACQAIDRKEEERIGFRAPDA